MRQALAQRLEVVTGNLANVVGPCTVRAEHHVTLLDALGHGPQCTAGEGSPDTRLVWMSGQEDRNELAIDSPPVVRQISRQVLRDLEVAADEATRKAFGRIGAPGGPA